MGIETAVVGVDFTESSKDALRWTARHFAPAARVVVVHSIAVPEPPHFLQGRFPSSGELVANARRGADGRVREMLGSLGVESAVVRIREGEPGEQLGAVAVEEGADLIVVGPHAERTGVWRLIGGTAQRVARRSPVPVLVARGLPEGPPRHILVALDESELTRPVLGWAARLSRAHGARVTAVHVVGDALLGALRIAGSEREARDARSSLLQSAEEWVDDQLRKAGLTGEGVRREVRVGDAAHEILSLGEQAGADLTVIGRSGAGRVGELILGSVANSVLRNGSGPILLVANERG